jgi:hypothetical protein
MKLRSGGCGVSLLLRRRRCLNRYCGAPAGVIIVIAHFRLLCCVGIPPSKPAELQLMRLAQTPVCCISYAD